MSNNNSSNAGVWVKAEICPKDKKEYCLRRFRGKDNHYDYFTTWYDGNDKAWRRNNLHGEWLDEQPIPQDDYWKQGAIKSFEKIMNLDIEHEDFNNHENCPICIARTTIEQLKSSPSPTPVNEKEVQAEWEFLIIMRENYEAAKRGSEEDFAGTTKKEAVIEIYEDLIDIIKNLPLKRSGREQEVIDYVNNLPQPSTPVQDEKEIGQGN